MDIARYLQTSQGKQVVEVTAYQERYGHNKKAINLHREYYSATSARPFSLSRKLDGLKTLANSCCLHICTNPKHGYIYATCKGLCGIMYAFNQRGLCSLLLHWLDSARAGACRCEYHAILKTLDCIASMDDHIATLTQQCLQVSEGSIKAET